MKSSASDIRKIAEEVYDKELQYNKLEHAFHIASVFGVILEAYFLKSCYETHNAKCLLQRISATLLYHAIFTQIAIIFHIAKFFLKSR
jgi:hypothetical protein